MKLKGLVDHRLFALYFAKYPTGVNNQYAQHNFVTFGDFEPYLCANDLGNPAAFERHTTWIVNRELDERKRFENNDDASRL